MTKRNDSFDKNFTKESTVYDDALSGKTWYYRLYNQFFWHERDSFCSVKEVLSMIPKDFNGKMLDIPAGTGVFTLETYMKLKNAEIHCVDYSKAMLGRYKNRVGNACPWIHFSWGDVGQLKYSNDSFDMVLSMNGYHCFPEKKQALEEIYRVLKPGGKFIGCTYIKGVFKRTDFCVKNIYNRMGIFMPPHEDEKQFKAKLSKYFHINKYVTKNSFACFECVKK